jgi:hypothetical protein
MKMDYDQILDELEFIYQEYVLENAPDRKKELPIVKRFLSTFGVDSNITDEVILDAYTKFDFLAVCLIRKKTKSIPENIILQFYEYRKQNNPET